MVDTQWFCHYPRSLACIHDNGGEFVGEEFRELLAIYSIHDNPTTVKKPQGNVIHERVHLVKGEMLRKLPTLKFDSYNDLIIHERKRRVLQSVAFVILATYNCTLGISPAEVIFDRNMVVNTKSVADWDHIRRKVTAAQIKNNDRENQSRIEHSY
mmetsp:Transcript_22718/g.32055  ORF Transcript_22718/g.32055 Transcript_22718/m.32055 type:complete len:155 (+) Transcript_22718:67-531(+)